MSLESYGEMVSEQQIILTTTKQRQHLPIIKFNISPKATSTKFIVSISHQHAIFFPHGHSLFCLLNFLTLLSPSIHFPVYFLHPIETFFSCIEIFWLNHP